MLSLHGKVVLSGGAAGISSLKRYQKLHPCQVEPVPPCSKTDLPMAKAEPVSSVDCTSVKTYFKKGKSHCAAPVREE